jgi:hypothetical protein
MVSLLAAPVLVQAKNQGTTAADIAVWAVALLLLAATIWSIRTSKKPAEAMDVEVASISGD